MHIHTLSTSEVEMPPVKATVNNLNFNWSYVSAMELLRIMGRLVVFVLPLYLHTNGEVRDIIFVDV